jgi:hypothetical protein
MERTRRFRAIVAGLAMALAVGLASPASAQSYTFTKVADSAEDNFDPFSFGCATINAEGDIAFKAGRVAPDGFNTIPGIYRANADGSLTTIAEDPKRFVTIGFNPSMNDAGQVSFAARIDGGNKPDTESILVGVPRRSRSPSPAPRTSSTSSVSTRPSATAERSPSRPSSTRSSASTRACSRETAAT